MPLEYPVACHSENCSHPVRFKIAAEWSDGMTHELKTYSLACEACLALLLRLAHARNKACPRTPGETLGKPIVYERQNARNPRDLLPRSDLGLG